MTLRKPTVLQLIGELTCGGAETIVVKLTNALRKENWEIIVSARKDGPMSEYLDSKSDVVFLNKKVTIDFKYIRDLVLLIKSKKIDVIHSHLFGNDLYGFVAAKITHRPIIQTIHGMDSIRSKKRILAYSMMAPFVDKIVTVADSLRNEMLKIASINEDKICTIHNGINIVDKFPQSSCHSLKDELELLDCYPIVGAVGTVKAVKGYDILIDAFSRISRQYPKAKLLIVGDYSVNTVYKEQLDSLVASHGLKERVAFTGYRQDAYRFFSIFDIYVLPSRSEGLSVALLEAMSYKKPLIATCVGDNTKILRNEETGLLIEPEDSAALSESILRLLRDKNFANYLGTNAARTVQEEYTIDRMIEMYKSLYLKVA
jgi:glycosyltransferase involved in cell wall biosynthesis